MLDYDVRILDFEMLVVELELLEIARVLCTAVGRMVNDKVDEALVLHDECNRHGPYLPCVGAQGQYCWHGHARGEEVPSVEIAAHPLHGLCPHRHLVHHLVCDQRPWKGYIQ